MIQAVGGIGLMVSIFVAIGFLIMLLKCYRKVEQGHALVRNGVGGTKVSFSGMVVIPILHRMEVVDISVKRVVIDRQGHEGLICKDNMRADIKVAFFVRVNKTSDDVLRVAQNIGCERASHIEALRELFEAKFSEALKTVGKHFEFTELYNSRGQFKEEIIKVIGTDLNGFILDDAAIDFLEQTPLSMLDPDNILDAEGIKKITRLTSEQKILSNKLNRERDKVITQQDVEAREATLELERQLTDAENRQKREVETIKAREEAETKKVQEEERLKSEKARIAVDEEVQVAEQNKERQVIVARKNKERTDAIETERIEKDRLVEATERERVVELARIEKDKALEVERKNIQNVIRDRVMVEKTVVDEQERMKDVQAFAGAERIKKVSVTKAEGEAESEMIKDIKKAEASRQVAEFKAEEDMLRVVKAAEASRQAAQLNAEEIVIQAEAKQSASDKEATATVKLGAAEARVLEMRLQAEAKGIEDKGKAMKLMDGVGREHEEFKLRLNNAKEIELAKIQTNKDVAAFRSQTLGKALESANIDIVGGESMFFEQIVDAVSGGKSVDKYVGSSEVLSDVKETFFNADPEYFQFQFKRFLSQFGVKSEDVKNLTVTAALSKLITMADNTEDRSVLHHLIAMAERSGMGKKRIGELRNIQSKEKKPVK